MKDFLKYTLASIVGLLVCTIIVSIISIIFIAGFAISSISSNATADIEDNSFLVMGGCGSTDKWKSTPLWWAREQASDEELALAVENLKKRNNKVDYILTHKCSNPEHTLRYDSAERFAEYREKNIEYKQWYAGHWHESKALDERHTIIFDVPKPLIKIQE